MITRSKFKKLQTEEAIKLAMEALQKNCVVRVERLSTEQINEILNSLNVATKIPKRRNERLKTIDVPSIDAPCPILKRIDSMDLYAKPKRNVCFNVEADSSYFSAF